MAQPTGSDARDFTLIVNSHLNDVYTYAWYMLFDRDEADEVVQKTFIKLYEHFGQLDLSQPIKPWLLRVAKNQCLDYLKRKKVTLFSELSEDERFEIPDNHPAIEEQLQSAEFVDNVKAVIADIPLPAREILLLKYFEDLTFEQIADTLDMPANTVKSHFYRGKIKLLKALETLVS